jgi:hypothetical protein
VQVLRDGAVSAGPADGAIVISDSPPAEPQGELAQAPNAADKKENKSAWKMIVTPVVLALVGFALLPVALLLYPSPAESSAPTYSRISVLTNQRITFITYAVVQVKPALAKIEIEVVRATPQPPTTSAAYANLVMGPPVGTSFPNCYGGCKRIVGPLPDFIWTVPLAFNSAGQAFEYFLVKARSLGVSDNGINALAALPEIFYDGTGAPEVLVGYRIPAAASYDWSALPPAAFTGSTVSWTEPIAGYDTPTKIAVGINQARQSSDNHLAFIAGALIGVAGGAVLSAIQKGLENILERPRAGTETSVG